MDTTPSTRQNPPPAPAAAHSVAAPCTLTGPAAQPGGADEAAPVEVAPREWHPAAPAPGIPLAPGTAAPAPARPAAGTAEAALGPATPVAPVAPVTPVAIPRLGAGPAGGSPGTVRRDGPAPFGTADGRSPYVARAALLVLADGRFPAGGHAHSGGAEAAVKAGRITGPGTLETFCRGRLHTSGLVAAALAAAAAAGLDPLPLDEAADARTPSPALRTTARKLGRQLMRAARAAWPSPGLDALAAARPRGAHQPVVLGLAVRAAGLAPLDAAHAAAYESVTGPATAAVRLLSLDPFAVSAVLARLTPDLDDVAARAAEAARRAQDDGVDALPAASAPLLDIYAEQHAAWPVRLFAS